MCVVSDGGAPGSATIWRVRTRLALGLVPCGKVLRPGVVGTANTPIIGSGCVPSAPLAMAKSYEILRKPRPCAWGGLLLRSDKLKGSL